jgi:hypothetical protein
MRFIAQCEGRFMLISYAVGDYRNGMLLQDWRPVLRELVGLSVPSGLTEMMHAVQSAASGLYVSFPLSFPLPVAELGHLLGVTPASVRAALEDMAVRYDAV